MASMIRFSAHLASRQTTECASHYNWSRSSTSLLQGKERSPKEEGTIKGSSLALEDQMDESSKGSQQAEHTISLA